MRAGRRGHGAQQRLPLPPRLAGCLSVSSASLPPYTLSHFSPMSLPDQGGGGQREREGERGKETEESKEELQGEKEERQIEDWRKKDGRSQEGGGGGGR